MKKIKVEGLTFEQIAQVTLLIRGANAAQLQKIIEACQMRLQ
jgi:hypothetical protein